jgi:hypothetical protein
MRQNQANPAGTLFHPWSRRLNGALGSVSIDADDCAGTVNVAGASQPCFGVKFFDIPQDTCVQLVIQVSQAGLGLEAIEVNGVAAGPLPVPELTVTNLCNNASAFGTNDIVWEYSVRSGGS